MCRLPNPLTLRLAQSGSGADSMGYVKTYRNSKNLFDKTNADVYESTNIVVAENQWNKYTGSGKTVRIPVSASTTYSISIDSAIETSVFRVLAISSEDIPVVGSPVYGTNLITTSADNTGTFTTTASTKYIILQFSATVFDDAINSLMLVLGSVSYNFEAYNVTAWYDFCKKKTATGWADSTAQKAPF